ncbi:MAG: TetR/AcrR family transcriptional regulator [Candidatus Velthaea sp.]
MATDRRKALIDTALTLFAREGYHASGIDKILAASGVAKMTLYKNFRSKEELIVAALEQCDAEFRAWIVADVERRAKTPAKRLLAIFDTYGAWFEGDYDGKFTGCSFVKAAGEYADPENPIHQTAAAHKDAVLGYIAGLARSAGFRKADALARRLFLLLEGALSLAYMEGNASSIRDAKDAAKTLIDAAA